MKKVHDSNDVLFGKLKALNDKKRAYNEKIKLHSVKIKAFLDTKKENNPIVNNLYTQMDNIHAEVEKCYEEKRRLDNEYWDKVYHYKDQQRLLKYIKEAQDKIKDLKKYEEKQRKYKEKEAKENAEHGAADAEGGEIVKPVEVHHFAYEMSVCDWLSAYFKNSLGGDKKDTVTDTKTTQGNTNSKIDEDISKGLIKPLVKNEDEFSIGLSGVQAPKKKTKGPKVSKRDQKVESSNHLVLDISIIQKIKDVGLAPPAKKTDLPNFIAQLEKKEKEFKQHAEDLKNGVITESKEINAPTTKTTTSTKVDVPKEETKQTHKETVKEPVKDVVKEPVKEIVKETPKEVVKETVKEPEKVVHTVTSTTITTTTKVEDPSETSHLDQNKEEQLEDVSLIKNIFLRKFFL